MYDESASPIVSGLSPDPVVSVRLGSLPVPVPPFEGDLPPVMLSPLDRDP